jgi:hypothetical protein
MIAWNEITHATKLMAAFLVQRFLGHYLRLLSDHRCLCHNKPYLEGRNKADLFIQARTTTPSYLSYKNGFDILTFLARFILKKFGKIAVFSPGLLNMVALEG